MYAPVLIIVIVSTIWVGIDSHKNQVSSDKNSEYNNGHSVAWVLMCLLIWIIGFPYYLIRRHQVLSGGSSAQTVSGADELQKFAELKEKGLLSDEEYEAKKKEILKL